MTPLSLSTPQPTRPSLPPPLTTTRGRGWACATVDVYAVGDLAFSGRSREHIVTVQLSGAAHLTRHADERPGEHDLRPGHVTVTPAGAPPGGGRARARARGVGAGGARRP